MNELKGLVIAAKQGDLYKEQIGILQQRITEKETVIRSLEGKDSVTVAAYEKEIGLLQLDLNAARYAYKKLRRQRNRERIGAGLVSAGLIYLSLKK